MKNDEDLSETGGTEAQHTTMSGRMSGSKPMPQYGVEWQDRVARGDPPKGSVGEVRIGIDYSALEARLLGSLIDKAARAEARSALRDVLDALDEMCLNTGGDRDVALDLASRVSDLVRRAF